MESCHYFFNDLQIRSPQITVLDLLYIFLLHSVINIDLLLTYITMLELVGTHFPFNRLI